MIAIDTARCTGCGACPDVCPMNALRLSEGVAVVDEALCNGCEMCITVCPAGAISRILVIDAETRPVPAPAPPALSPAAPTAPWLTAALVFIGREVVPRVARSLLDLWDSRRETASPAATIDPHAPALDAPPAIGTGAPRQYRRRRGRS